MTNRSLRRASWTRWCLLCLFGFTIGFLTKDEIILSSSSCHSIFKNDKKGDSDTKTLFYDSKFQRSSNIYVGKCFVFFSLHLAFTLVPQIQ